MKKINSLNGKLKARKSRFADLTLHPAMEDNIKKYKEWEKTKEEIVGLLGAKAIIKLRNSQIVL